MTTQNKDWQFETVCVHGAYTPDPETGSRQVPIYMTSAHEFKNSDHAAAVFSGQEEGFAYARFGSPTNNILQKRLAMLEGMEAGLVTPTGMAAILMMMMSLAQAGDEIVLSSTLYGGTHRLFSYSAPRMGITPVWVSTNNPDDWAKAITNKTRFIFIETPGNPSLNVIDIEMVSKLAKQHGIPLVVDNTFCTPYLQQPAQLGADVVIHSTTKYISGNCSAMGGIVLGSKSYIDRVSLEEYRTTGPTPSPFNSWLLLLSLETLPLRMDKHCSNAKKVVDFLQQHAMVDTVTYPGLESHPEHAIAKKQMKDFGGMISFEIKGGVLAGKTFIDNLQLCSLVPNLGDTRTLAIHPASTTHSPMSEEAQLAAGIKPGTVRLSIGVENPADIITDMQQALDAAGKEVPSGSVS